MTAKWPWRLAVATYNILADAYVKPEYYPRCAPEDFAPSNRHPKLDARVTTLGTDVICLQEVEYAAFTRIDALLRPNGYRGRWAHRPGGKPDGCATFVRKPWRMSGASVLELPDGARKPTNRIALLSILRHESAPEDLVVVANAHLEWHPDDASPADRHGLHQAEALIGFLRGEDACVVCGDFNAAPDGDVLRAFGAAGLADPHPPSTATFNSNGRPRKLDYLLHGRGLRAAPFPTTRVRPDTALPSAVEPSDHVPLVATFAPTGA